MKKYLTTVPFSGFYESVHSMNIDDALENFFYDSESGEVISDTELLHYLWFNCDFNKVRGQYAAAYVDQLNKELDIYFEFERMDSPREYNFITDRIFCYVSEAHIERMLDNLAHDKVKQYVRDNFTSRDGFASFYSDNFDTWILDGFASWKAVQIGAIVECWIDQELGKEWETYFMDDLNCNGNLSNWIAAATPNIAELYARAEALTRANNEG